MEMTALLVFEQILNSLQYGLMLFLMAAGLTLVLGIMDMINLAHGSLYMLGAYIAASVYMATGNFVLAVAGAALGMGVVGLLLEFAVVRHLYHRDHLTQVLATFALILIFNELVRIFWGPQPLLMSVPLALSGPIELLPGLYYPTYRLLIIGVGLVLAVGLFWLVNRTRMGMWVRAGASNREMARAMGVDIRILFRILFALGAALAGIAGALLGPIFAVQVGMGENVLTTLIVAIVIGGIGSIKGAFVGALMVGFVDTAGRAFLPLLFYRLASPDVASNLGPTLASVLIYVLMAVVLFFRPQGLFPVRT